MHNRTYMTSTWKCAPNLHICWPFWLLLLIVLLVFSCIHSTAKSSSNCTKLLAYLMFGLPSFFKMFWSMHMFPCTLHVKNVHAIFGPFLSDFRHFEAFPHWKLKMEATLQLGISVMQLFLIHFFLSRTELLQNSQNKF